MEVPEPQRYEDRYQNMQCAYCEKWVNRGVTYGDHFLCEAHEDDGAALALVAHKLAEEAKTDIRLTPQEEELLMIGIDSLKWSQDFDSADKELLHSISTKLQLSMEMRKREPAANHQE